MLCGCTPICNHVDVKVRQHHLRQRIGGTNHALVDVLALQDPQRALVQIAQRVAHATDVRDVLMGRTAGEQI